MSLEAGSVFVRLGGLFVRDDFDKYDRALDSARVQAKTPVDAKLGADSSGLTRDLAAARAELGVWKQNPYDAKLGLDTTGFERDLAMARYQLVEYGKEEATATLSIDDKEAMAEYAKLDALRRAWQQARATAEFRIDTRQADEALASIEAKMVAIRATNPFSNLRAQTNEAGIQLTAVKKLVEEVGAAGGGLGGGGGLPPTSPGGGGGRGGGGFINPLSVLGRLLHRPGGFFGLGGFSLGTMIGLGPEHLLTAGGAFLGSGLGAATLGGGTALTGILGKELVGGGADFLVSHETDQNVKALYQAQENLNTAIAQYGKNSQQAILAQRQYNAQLNSLSADVGPKATKAEADLASKLNHLTDSFQKSTAGAQIWNSKIKEQIVSVAQAYVPNIGKFTEENLKIADRTLKPFFNWLKGPDGMGLVKQLEHDFQRGIPNSLGAATSGFKVLLQIAVDAEKHSGGLMAHLDHWLTRLSNDPQKISAWVNHELGDLHNWAEFFKAVIRDVAVLIHSSSHEGTALVKTLTEILNHWHDWATSAAGQNTIHTFLENRQKELLAIIQLVRNAVDNFGHFYGAVQPLVPVVTKVAHAVGSVLGAIDKLGAHNKLFEDMFVIPLGAFLLSWRLLGKETTLQLFQFHKIGGVLDGLVSKAKVWLGLSKDATAATGAANAESSAGGTKGSGGGGFFSKLFGGGSGLNGMLTGIRGAGVGSEANPVAVVVVAGATVGAQGFSPKLTAQTAAQTDAEASSLAASSASTTTASTLAAEAAPAAEVGLLSRATGALSGIAENLGAAGLVGIGGATVSSLASSLIGGKVGRTVGSIGDTTALGAAIGTAIEPGIGTAIGAGLGAIGGALKSLLGGSGGPSRTQRVSASTTANVSGGLSAVGMSAKQFDAELQKELGQFYADTTKSVDRAVGRGVYQVQVHVAPTVDTTAGRQAISIAQTMGRQVGSALIDGWSKYVVANEPTIFTQFKKSIKGLPQAAQATAAEMVTKYVTEMQKQGKLANGSAQDFVDQVESAFPNLVAFMGTTAQSATQAWNRNFNTTSVTQQVMNMVNTIGQTIQGLPIITSTNADQVQQKWSQSWSILETDSKSKYETVRLTAQNALRQMVTDAQQELPNIPTLMSQLSDKGKTALGNNFKQAAKVLKENLDGMTTNTRKGMEDINKLLGGEVKVLSQAPGFGLPTFKDTLKWTTNLNNIFSTTVPHHAGGGYAPGAEFGLDDHMTLVDPMGRPRAKMAGDEAIFTRYQMPYVEAGLSLLGFDGAQGLWSSVTRPHGYAGGGSLRGNITIGGGGYSQAIPQLAISSVVGLVRGAFGNLGNIGFGGIGNSSRAGGNTSLPASYIPAGQHLSIISQALRAAGVPDTVANQTAVNMIVSHEDPPWDPAIVNRWDSNWQAGHPSVGLAQVIAGTFAEHVPPALRNVGPFLYGVSVNPIANIAAGVRYAISRYGSLQNVPGVVALTHGSSYVGYRTGGRLPRAHSAKATGITHSAPKRQTTTAKAPSKLKSVLSALAGNLPASMKPFEKLAASFAADDALAATLTNQYNQENQLYSLYDTGSTGVMPIQDLNNLEKLQEEQWNLYYNEYNQLPGAIKKVEAFADKLIGSKGGTKVTVNRNGKRVLHYTPPSGVDATLKALNLNRQLVTTLTEDETKMRQAAASTQHKISSAALAQAKKYAAQINQLTDAMLADTQKSTNQTIAVAGLTQQMARTTDPKKAATLQQQITQMQNNRAAQSQANQLNAQMTHLRQQQQSAASQYRTQGFALAWAEQEKSYGIQSKIAKLNRLITQLQDLLTREQHDLALVIGSANNATGSVTGGGKKGTSPIYASDTAGGNGTAAGGLLAALQDRLHGSPDGSSQPITDTLETVGYNVLQLITQGAQAPQTKKFSVSQITDLFNKEGIALPVNYNTQTGQNTQTANTQALADFSAFTQALTNTFASFGSNFAASGTNPFSGAGLLSNTQYYGAASGGGGGPVPAGGDTNVNITQNFGGGPPDPHTYSAGLSHELGALV